MQSVQGALTSSLTTAVASGQLMTALLGVPQFVALANITASPPIASTPQPSSGSSTFSSIYLAIIICGGVALLCALVGVLYYLKRRGHQTSAHSKPLHHNDDDEENYELEVEPVIAVTQPERRMTLDKATKRCRAVYAYEAESNSKEISFRKGDEFDILNQTETGWWFVKSAAKAGWVPANYMKLVEPPRAEEPRKVQEVDVDVVASERTVTQINTDAMYSAVVKATPTRGAASVAIAAPRPVIEPRPITIVLAPKMNEALERKPSRTIHGNDDNVRGTSTDDFTDDEDEVLRTEVRVVPAPRQRLSTQRLPEESTLASDTEEHVVLETRWPAFSDAHGTQNAPQSRPNVNVVDVPALQLSSVGARETVYENLPPTQTVAREDDGQGADAQAQETQQWEQQRQTWEQQQLDKHQEWERQQQEQQRQQQERELQEKLQREDELEQQKRLEADRRRRQLELQHQQEREQQLQLKQEQQRQQLERERLQQQMELQRRQAEEERQQQLILQEQLRQQQLLEQQEQQRQQLERDQQQTALQAEIKRTSSVEQLSSLQLPVFNDAQATLADAQSIVAVTSDATYDATQLETESMASSSQETVLYVAIFDYAGIGEERDLQFAAGDPILVSVKGDNGWWAGSCHGQAGWFPATYVRPLNPYSKMIEPDLDDDINDEAIYEFIASEFSEDVDDETGHLYELPVSEVGSVDAEADSTTYDPKNDPACYYTALYPYQAATAEELNFLESDIVVVTDVSEGWWRGMCKGQSGWFPATYVWPSPNAYGTDELKTIVAAPNVDEGVPAPEAVQQIRRQSSDIKLIAASLENALNVRALAAMSQVQPQPREVVVAERAPADEQRITKPLSVQTDLARQLASVMQSSKKVAPGESPSLDREALKARRPPPMPVAYARPQPRPRPSKPVAESGKQDLAPPARIIHRKAPPPPAHVVAKGSAAPRDASTAAPSKAPSRHVPPPPMMAVPLPPSRLAALGSPSVPPPTPSAATPRRAHRPAPAPPSQVKSAAPASAQPVPAADAKAPQHPSSVSDVASPRPLTIHRAAPPPPGTQQASPRATASTSQSSVAASAPRQPSGETAVSAVTIPRKMPKPTAVEVPPATAQSIVASTSTAPTATPKPALRPASIAVKSPAVADVPVAAVTAKPQPSPKPAVPKADISPAPPSTEDAPPSVKQLMSAITEKLARPAVAAKPTPGPKPASATASPAPQPVPRPVSTMDAVTSPTATPKPRVMPRAASTDAPGGAVPAPRPSPAPKPAAVSAEKPTPQPKPRLLSNNTPSSAPATPPVGGTAGKAAETSSGPKLRKVVVSHVATRAGELTLAVGDMLVQLSEADERGMAKGMLKSGVLGLYPVSKVALK